MASPEKHLTDDMDALDDLNNKEVLTTGVYCCLQCQKDIGESAELPVTGRTRPRDLCSLHPANTKENFQLIKQLEWPGIALKCQAHQPNQQEYMPVVIPLKDAMES